MNWFLNLLCGFSWPQLIAVQRSFSSKALTAVPVIAFAVAALSKIDIASVVLGNWRIHVVFWGALIFLVGQLVAWKRRPVEFVTHLDTEDAMAGIVNLSNQETCKSRLNILKTTVEAFRKKAPRGLLREDLLVATQRVATLTSQLDKIDWEAALPLIVTSQRRLSAFDRPTSRAIAVLLLGIGIVLMILPAIVNVAITIKTVLPIYGSWLFCILGYS